MKKKSTSRNRKTTGFGGGTAPLSKEAKQEYARNEALRSQQEASAVHLDAVKNAVHKISREVKLALDEKGYFVCDNFLGQQAGGQMLREAVGLHKGGLLQLGESTRWNEEKNEAETYKKENVYTMQIQGGEEYALSPRLVEYVVQLTKSLSGTINEVYDKPVLLETHQTNKLAVCTGDGSHYAKHYDNQGGEDRRKLTALYYMNPQWKEENGGCFRAYDRDSAERFTDIQPLFDRFFCFWSDVLIHSVQPSFAPTEAEHRYALTVWLNAAEEEEILRDEEAETIHFPNLASPELLSG